MCWCLSWKGFVKKAQTADPSLLLKHGTITQTGLTCSKITLQKSSEFGMAGK